MIFINVDKKIIEERLEAHQQNMLLAQGSTFPMFKHNFMLKETT